MHHRNDLFTLNGTPIQFYMRPCPEKARIRLLIEHGGGQLVSKLENEVFYLIPPGSKVVNEDSNALSCSYIYSCVEANKLLSIEDFRISHKMKSENEKSEDEGGARVKKQTEFFLSTPKVFGRRKEYTHEEDMLILNIISQNNWYYKARGKRIWVAIESLFKHRKWDSLRGRFLKCIMNMLSNYNLSEEKVTKFSKIHSRLDSFTSSDDDVSIDSLNTAEPVHLSIIHYMRHNNCFIETALNSESTWKELRNNGLLKKYSTSELKSIFQYEILPNIFNETYALDFKVEELANLKRYKTDFNLKPHQHTSGETFTGSENCAIFNFISEKNCFSDLKSVEVWQEMARDETLKCHSANSLRKHFETVLLCSLHEDTPAYGLTLNKIRPFLDYFKELSQPNHSTAVQTEEKFQTEEKKLQSSEENPLCLENLHRFDKKVDYAILGFIVEKNCFDDLDADEIWLEMNKVNELKHLSADLLRHHFKKVILPCVESYNYPFNRRQLNSLLEYRFSRTWSCNIQPSSSTSQNLLPNVNGQVLKTNSSPNKVKETIKFMTPFISDVIPDSNINAQRKDASKESPSKAIHLKCKSSPQKTVPLRNYASSTGFSTITDFSSSNSSLDSFDQNLKLKKEMPDSPISKSTQHQTKKRELFSNHTSENLPLLEDGGNQSTNINVTSPPIQRNQFPLRETPERSRRVVEKSAVNEENGTKRIKLCQSSEKTGTASATDSSQIEMIESAKIEVIVVRKTLQGWCSGGNESTISVCKTKVRKINEKLKKIELALRKAELTMSKPILEIKPEDI